MDQTNPCDETVMIVDSESLPCYIDSLVNPKSKKPNAMQPNQSNHQQLEHTQVGLIMTLVPMHE